ncbi:DUF4189 domain-containing protein [Pseudomonas sp. CGJS7]|uniref:DUF4189 domain-containing protein n=1 Tax=Pseudomonas sp. CGJS7 TaxID=3109348 RepID=UPI003009671C
MRFYAITLFSLTLTPMQSGAEGGCPAGQIPYSGTSAEGSAASMASCGPIPYRSSPAPAWENRWGAVATDNQGTFGVSADKRSQKKAEKAAIAHCKERGGGQCDVTLSYKNQCMAIATSEVNSVSARAPDIEAAKQDSLEKCAERSNGNECWVYYYACSLPVRAN